MKELIEIRAKISLAIRPFFGRTEREPLELLRSALKCTSLFVHCGRVAGLVLLTVALAHKAIAQSGHIERGTISSAALAGNLFNDPTNRPYAVYLPPSYAPGQRRYPVFYMLHGWTGSLDIRSRKRNRSSGANIDADQRE